MISNSIEGSEISKKIDSVWNAVHDEVNNKDINRLFAIWKPKASSIPLSIIVKIPKKKPVPKIQPMKKEFFWFIDFSIDEKKYANEIIIIGIK